MMDFPALLDSSTALMKFILSFILGAKTVLFLHVWYSFKCSLSVLLGHEFLWFAVVLKCLVLPISSKDTLDAYSNLGWELFTLRA